ncbi:metal-dependent hydrolase [Nocardia stercoris]|uniref:Metal-dependent hydrolase n=1 Tax=Nocardia stercoris TaxID=2483361 RepID=A0A3M2KW98_9NOCA|nr:metal-dependent hydrolase [Nocardia stercoris]RMI29491.1 metal-dependent hydrolase [Nocardia stercoris]
MKLLPFRGRRPAHEPGGNIALRARNVQFDWRHTPLVWMPAEPIASHLINALNMLLPEGERMFCQAFGEALPYVHDAQLREDMLGFIGQESMHAETHGTVLDEVFTANGIDPQAYVAQMEYLFRKSLGPGDGTDARADYQRLVDRIGLIGSLEHFFAFLGDWILNADLERFGADPRMLDLFRWHGAEEVEHRNVAHDVAEYFGVGYVRRGALMLIVFPVFLTLLVRGTRFMVHADPNLPDHGYPVLIGKVFGAMWRGALPTIPALLWSALSTFQPGYSPEGVGSTAQAIAYLAKSPAAQRLAS